MLLERTISQLDIGQVPPDLAEELGHLGYIQWLGALRGGSCYLSEAIRAHEAARPFRDTSPAIAVFCELLLQSMASPFIALDLRVPVRERRGGRRGRRPGL
ncbi:MAG: hypothetical protein ACU0DW_08420 [Shimia sp.]